ncbi:unnamed protein product [Nesidiocoris tenuis]|uniref:Amino acid transporter transmembrane domain-containing protein n=1 Tax=Nesidiocoris tenuis TaxID=355587 RepID=A0A6H5GWU0_9HEMI|nr:unnamed protein product [Nesidiocoris tenuis]
MTSTQSVPKNLSDTSYDPHENRTTGTINNFQAFLHLVKCSFGIGVLAFPYGFKHAGMIAGMVLGISVSVFCVYCFHVLFHTMNKIAAELRVPYVTVPDAMIHSMTHTHAWCAPMVKLTRPFIGTIIFICYFGICTAYINYLTVMSLTISEKYKSSAEGPVNLVRSITSIIWVIPLFMVNCLRDLKTLAPASLIGNVTTLIAMCMVLGAILDPTEPFSDTWESYGELSTAPLFIGTILFAVESFGVIVAVERDVIQPKRFLGWFGVFNISMSIVVAWYLFVGIAGYWKFGADTKATIVHTITRPAWLGTTVQIIMGVAIFCSYPLQCFVAIEVMWTNYLSLKVTKNNTLWEYVFRFVFTLCTGLVSLLVPRLDLIVSLVGAFCLSLLGFVIPGLLDYNVVSGRHGWKRPFILVRDIIIMLLGLVAFAIGVYSPLYNLVEETTKNTTRSVYFDYYYG